MRIETILTIMGIFGGFIVGMIMLIIFQKHQYIKKQALVKRIQAYIIDRYINQQNEIIRFPKHLLMKEYQKASIEMNFSDKVKIKAYEDFTNLGLIDLYLKDLNHPQIYRRKRAAFYLSFFPIARIKYALLERLKVEPLENVKVALVHALKHNIDQRVLQVIFDTLIGCKRFYQTRVIGILQTNLQNSEAYLHSIARRKEIEIKEVFVRLANAYYKEEYYSVLVNELKTLEEYFQGNKQTIYQGVKRPRLQRLYYDVLHALSSLYGYDLNQPNYLSHEDAQVVRIATFSICKSRTFETIKTILSYTNGNESDEIRAEAILSIIDTKQDLVLPLFELIEQVTDPKTIKLITHVLSHKMEYFILHTYKRQPNTLKSLIEYALFYGYREEIIDFLNDNHVIEIENLLLNIIQKVAHQDDQLLLELNDYLKPELFIKMGFTPFRSKPPIKEQAKPEIRKTKWLFTLLVIAVVLLPLLILGSLIPDLFYQPLMDTIGYYIVRINQVFIFYYITVNLVYYFLAFLSLVGAKDQLRNWEIKNQDMLFEKEMLASISIIAPAYNEELSIVESVQSLLNLNYPKFEVIVVNDGSKDATLSKLITHFNLERRSVHNQVKIETSPVKAVYQNRYYPNLLVIDKVNGGKADALNVGINYSHSDYVCGIDADSLLEPDSLLKLMSSMLDYDQITLALGGSIVPINNASIDMGEIVHLPFPKSNLARFQTIEYLRAFNIGRTGFARLNSLLIVSGAFGLFEKQILIESGGYLTVKSMKKDTVGEDMELVVRITRNAYESNLNFRIDYISNAKCFTEVPEERKSFFRQRNRWQRGLVDILSYHRKMIGNRKYKQAGLIGMVYFFLFEMMGPLFEVQAYLSIIVGFIIGILNFPIFLLLLLVTVELGVFLSLFALYINEKDTMYLTKKEMFLMIFYAIIENFGWRQIISIYRVKGFLSSFKETHAWGQMNRVGFKKN